MRHRMGVGGITGFGNPRQARLRNNKQFLTKEIKQFCKDSLKEYFSKDGWLDFDIEENRITVGQEPAYMYEHLNILCLQKEKGNSFFQTGIAWGGYGSSIAITTKFYKNYKYKSKFIRFIDKWHKIIYE